MPTRYFVIDGRQVIDPRSTRAWRALRDRVVGEEPLCRLRLVGCTEVSTTADHIIPVSQRPDLAMERSNHRGACRSCNRHRGVDDVVSDDPSSVLDIFSHSNTRASIPSDRIFDQAHAENSEISPCSAAGPGRQNPPEHLPAEVADDFE